jgi:hypothetical protein
MFKKMSVALLGSACTFIAGVNSASAFDNSVPNDPPAVLYQPQVPPAPVRVASNSISPQASSVIGARSR